MRIGEARRTVISKLFINFSGIIFGLLVISPIASGKINNLLIVFGLLALGITGAIAMFSEPKGIIKEGQ